MGAALDIFIDLQARRIVPGVASSGPVDLTFYQDDTYHIVLHGLLADEAAPLGTIYSPAPISYTAVAAGLFAGGADAPPTDGTWKVKFDGATTPALRWNVGKGELAAALNALATVTTAGGVKVLESGPGHFYTIQWQAETPAAQFEVVENELSPVCLPRIRMNPAVEGQVLIKLVRVPLAFTDEFELPLPPPVTIEPVRAGTTQRNEIQAVVIPEAAAGEFALSFNGTASQVVPVAEASAAEIQRVLNELYADAVQRFAVTNPSRGRFYVEFVGPLAKTDHPLLGVEMFSQTPLPTPKLSLPITAEVPVDLELLARDRIPIIFEIAAWNGAEKTVLAQQAVALVNNAIDSGLAEELEQSGAVMTRTNTVYIDNTESTPIVIAAPGAVYTPAEAAEELVIEHALNTFHPDVRVHHQVSAEPEEWIEVPDDQYEATATTANHVTVIGLPLSVDPEDQYFFGRWKIFVASPDAKVKILEHSHPTTEVFEGAKTLAVILDELRAALPTGWPNIPANKLTGPILATQIDIHGVAEALKGSAKFVTTLREVLKDATIVSALATELRTNAEFAETIKTLLASESVIEALVLSLKESATYHDFVRETVHEVLQGSGGVLPDGSVLFSVPSFEIAVPAPKTIPAPSQKVEIINDVEVQTDDTKAAGSADYNVTKSGTLRVTRAKETSKSFREQETLVYDLLSPAVTLASAEPVAVAGVLPTMEVATAYYQASAIANARTEGPRRGRTFKTGTGLTRENGHWYEVRVDGLTLYATEMEHTLFTIEVTEQMWHSNSRFAAQWIVAAALVGNVIGMVSVVVELGTRTGASMAWTQIGSTAIPLTDAVALHAFEFTATKDADGTTGELKQYGDAAEVDLTGRTAFALRARIAKFDCEKSWLAGKEARGCLKVRMPAPNVSIARIES